MFVCNHCQGTIVGELRVTATMTRITCLRCSKPNIILRVAGEVELLELEDEEEVVPIEEPIEEELPWLDQQTSEESFQEMSEQFIPTTDIPRPAVDLSNVDGDPRAYQRNMNYLWSKGWEEIGKYMGQELYSQIAEPALDYISTDPEMVGELFSPKGTGNAMHAFLSDIKDRTAYELEQEGLGPTGTRGTFKFPMRYPGQVREPDRDLWLDIHEEFIPYFRKKYKDTPKYETLRKPSVEERKKEKFLRDKVFQTPEDLEALERMTESRERPTTPMFLAELLRYVNQQKGEDSEVV